MQMWQHECLSWYIFKLNHFHSCRWVNLLIAFSMPLASNSTATRVLFSFDCSFLDMCIQPITVQVFACHLTVSINLFIQVFKPNRAVTQDTVAVVHR